MYLVSTPENNIKQKKKKEREIQHDNFLPENFCCGTVTENKIIIVNNKEQTSNPKHLSSIMNNQNSDKLYPLNLYQYNAYFFGSAGNLGNRRFDSSSAL